MRLKDEETTIVDLGNVTGLSIRNLIDESVKIYVDYQDENGTWVAITGEWTLKAKDTFERTRIELGHERVRVGVRGPEDGRDLVEVKP